jgi:hypothetical protein
MIGDQYVSGAVKYLKGIQENRKINELFVAESAITLSWEKTILPEE